MSSRLSWRVSCVFIVTLNIFSAPRAHAQAGGVQAEGPRYHLVRSVSGSKGTPQGGRFAMEDPRTIFYLPEDRQVIVYAEWDGPIGKHHIEGFWKSPAGKTAALTDFDYDAKVNRFGAYFTLSLNDSMELGAWSLEAHVDGEIAGTHSFQILAGKLPAGSLPSRKMLTPSQLYDQAVRSTFIIEALDRTGQKFRIGSAFLLDPTLVITAFEVIDGATRLHLTAPDGSQFDTDQVLAWNRRQDWAVLKASPAKSSGLQRAPDGSWSIGDTCFYLDIAPEGNRVATNVSIDGKTDFPGSGMRLSISAAPTDRAVGSALLNEYGEVVAVVGGTVIPGTSATNFLESLSRLPTTAGTVYLRGGLAVPIANVTTPAESSGATLGALEAKGEFMPPVIASRNVLYGQLARSLSKDGLPSPLDRGAIFSKRDPKIYIYISWEGREKTKGVLTMRVFDIDNHLLNKNALEKPMKFSLGRNDSRTTTWEIPTSPLAPGIYRIDVWLDDLPAWRTFFRLSE